MKVRKPHTPPKGADSGWRIPAKYLTGERLDFCRGMLRGLNDSGVLTNVFDTWKEILSHRSVRKIRTVEDMERFYATHMAVIEQIKGMLGVFFEDLPRTASKAQLEEAARAAVLALPPPDEDGELAGRTDEFLKRMQGGDTRLARQFIEMIRGCDNEEESDLGEAGDAAEEVE